MSADQGSCLFFMEIRSTNSLKVLVLLYLSFITQAQTLSESPITTPSPTPPVVVPAKRVTVSQALRFGEQAELRPDTLANRSDLPLITAKQSVQFDHDLLRWELGFDKGDGYHKLRIRVTNLSDTPQGCELLYAPTASRNGIAEASWRIVASQMIQPGQVFTDWQSVLIEKNITQIVFLLRRRDIPAKERAISAYSRNPEADYPVPAAVSLKADLTGDSPKVVAVTNNSAPLEKGPLILPAMPVLGKLPNASIGENPKNHFRQAPFKLERDIDLPVLPGAIQFELEGLRWEIQQQNQCSPSTSRQGGALISTTRCTLKLDIIVTNLTNDKQAATLMTAIPEQGDGTVRDSWNTTVQFPEIYPGRSTHQERHLQEIKLTDTTQKATPLRWLLRAYRQPSHEELTQRQARFYEAVQKSNNARDPYNDAYHLISDPPAAYWEVQVNDPSYQQNKQKSGATQPSGATGLPPSTEEVEQIHFPANMTSPPKIITRIRAEYTPEARQQREQGIVSLAITIRGDGTVETDTIKILKGLRFGLNEKAIEAVKKSTFNPARCDNQPCTVRTKVELSFTLLEPNQTNPTTNEPDNSKPKDRPRLNGR
ncbi:MAG: energy transducer TonB [Blastocatellia bacterium]